FDMIGYLLPVMFLLTPQKLSRLWHTLKGYRWYLISYTVCIYLLAFYGGSDILRFTSYMLVPLLIMLAALLKLSIPRWQIALALVLVILWNKTFLVIPTWDWP